MTQTIVKKPSARKSLSSFTNIFDVEKEVLSVVLDLKIRNAEPLKLDVDCVHFKNGKGTQKSMNRINLSFVYV